MSENSQNPGSPSEPQSPPPAAPTPPNAEATPSTSAPESPGNRWISLVLAVAVVMVGGFILGRASGPTNTPSAPQPGRLAAHVPLNVPTARFNPVMLARIREARQHGGTRMPAVLGQPAPQATLMPAPGEGPPHPSPAVTRDAVAALRGRVDTCFGQNPPPHPGQIFVAARIHGQGEAGSVVLEPRLARSSLGSAQAEQCVLQTLQNAPIAQLKGEGDATVILPFSYAGK